MSDSLELRVKRKREEGWEIAEEYEDRVVLERPRGLHAPSTTLSLLTLGFANVYCAIRDLGKPPEQFVIYDERY